MRDQVSKKRPLGLPGDKVKTAAAQPVAVAYIGGTSFCGSTLMSFLLNAQPGVTSIGEVAWAVPPENAGGYQCSCGATLDNCPFWSSVTAQMKQRGYLFDADHWNTAFDIKTNGWVRKLAVRPLGTNVIEGIRDSLVRRVPGWRAHLAERGKRNAALVQSIASLTGASVFVDASKDPARVRFLRAYSLLQPYVIHLVRDAPAFVNSVIKKQGDRSFDIAIRWWNSTVLRMERLRSTTPDNRWLRVHYEDIAANPDREIDRVLQFFGLSQGRANLDFRHSSHHIIGNRMRLRDTSEVRPDVSWRKDLSQRQVDEIMRRTMRYRRLVGYGS